MANPWLAIDVATAPAHRAREMRRAWERFVGDGPEQFSVRGESSLVREPIAASWRRSAGAGGDPSGFRGAPGGGDAAGTSGRWGAADRGVVAPIGGGRRRSVGVPRRAGGRRRR